MKVRGDDINKELGADNVWNYTEAQIKDRFDFLCKISYSDKGPTVKTFQKWMSMWLYIQNENVVIEDPPMDE